MGESVEVQKLPPCDICVTFGRREVINAAYDGATKDGPWAYMCEDHFVEYGVGLGTGRGQRLILVGSGEDAGEVGEVHPGQACEEAGCFGDDETDALLDAEDDAIIANAHNEALAEEAMLESAGSPGLRPVEFPPMITNKFSKDEELCQWFLKCENKATKSREHPVLGSVRVCDSCDTFAEG